MDDSDSNGNRLFQKRQQSSLTTTFGGFCAAFYVVIAQRHQIDIASLLCGKTAGVLAQQGSAPTFSSLFIW
jgi:hypothetical protein